MAETLSLYIVWMIRIFLPEAMLQERRRLLAEFNAGRLEEAEFYSARLELDPADFVALLSLAGMAAEEGHSEQAITWLRRCAEACPFDPQPCTLWAQEAANAGQEALAAGLFELGLQKTESLRRSPDHKLRKRAKKAVPAEIRAVRVHLNALREAEPDEVTAILRPYRLVQQVIAAGEDGVSPAVVDALLRLGPVCQAQLLGVLRGWVETALPADGVAAEASLALLGEIGGPRNRAGPDPVLTDRRRLHRTGCKLGPAAPGTPPSK